MPWRTHGEGLNKNRTPEYRAWYHIKDRCFNSNTKHFHRYGGRGITMCTEWTKSYEKFLAYMGRRPSSLHSIDRINNDGNYEPGNVRWATRSEQRRNQKYLRPWTSL